MAELDQGLRDLLATARKDGASRTIGLDIEKRYLDNLNSYISGRHIPIQEFVSAIMLCCGDFCLIIQLCNNMSSPEVSMVSKLVSKFLELQELTFGGVGIKHCIEALETIFGIKCRDAMDLRDLAAIVTQSNILRTYKLVDLALLVGNQVFYKDELLTKCNGAALSDWSCGTLSRHQIEAATWRAYLAFYIGNHFYARN
ncbi:uncharacterized protein LOC110732921 [Chenopodium quinoa]|nr:uncharacterized protein LOC110732921 [Chenopodium quinoa]